MSVLLACCCVCCVRKCLQRPTTQGAPSRRDGRYLASWQPLTGSHAPSDRHNTTPKLVPFINFNNSRFFDVAGVQWGLKRLQAFKYDNCRIDNDQVYLAVGHPEVWCKKPNTTVGMLGDI
jgi:hypothetical protein